MVRHLGRQPTVGMVGAGQLARMSYQAAIPLDLRLRLLAERPDDAAAQVAADVTIGTPATLASLASFAEGCDAVTFDHELVPAEHLRELERRGAVLRPTAATMRYAQDKGYQRTVFTELGLPVPAFALVDTVPAVERFADEHGYPVVLKTCSGGYDGRGVWLVEEVRALPGRWREAGGGAAPLLVEHAVTIERELAVLLTRRPSGDRVAYPLIETVQRDGICTELTVPAPVPDAVAAAATALGARVADAVGVAGILAVELFWTGSDLLVNEVATRPHNSGHWTIEGAVTSQFANHLRGVLDWPLGGVTLTAPAVTTVNVLGPEDGSDPRSRLGEALGVPGVAVHLYGKDARPGRKLGHVTATGDEPSETRDRAHRAAAALIGTRPRAAITRSPE